MPGYGHLFWNPEASGRRPRQAPPPVAGSIPSDSPVRLPRQPGQGPPPPADPVPREWGVLPCGDSLSSPVTHPCPVAVSALTPSHRSHTHRWNFRNQQAAGFNPKACSKWILGTRSFICAQQAPMWRSHCPKCQGACSRALSPAWHLQKVIPRATCEKQGQKTHTIMADLLTILEGG